MNGIDSMSFTTLALFGGAVTFAWPYLQRFVGYLRSAVVCSAIIEGEAGGDLVAYLQIHGRILKVGDRALASDEEFVRPLDRVTTVVWEVPSTQPRLIILKPNGKSLLSRMMTVYSPEGKNHSVSNSPEPTVVVVSFLRFGFDLKKLLLDAIEWKQSLNSGNCRYRIVRECGMGRVGADVREFSGKL